MESPAQPQHLAWQEATVIAVIRQTSAVKSFFLDVPDWPRMEAGQHVDVRLTAPDGYQAERSYSVASAPGSRFVELVVERLPDGEVSPFFHEVLAPGDTVELRGPIGGHFIWRPAYGGPLLLVGGGSGVVPLVSMARHRRAVAPDVPALLVYSARSAADVIFHDELFAEAKEDPHFDLVVTLTRQGGGDRFRAGRIDRALVAELRAMLGEASTPRTYVCGSTGFVEAATALLVDSGLDPASIRTERYGGVAAGA